MDNSKYILSSFKKEDEINIYDLLVKNFIINYNEIDNENITDYYKKDYMEAINVNEGNISSEEKDLIVGLLDQEYEKYLLMQEENETIINDIVNERVNDIKKIYNKAKKSINEVDQEKITINKVIFIMKLINRLNFDSYEDKIYTKNLPLNNYHFEFYNGIPMSKSFEGLLVTRSKKSLDVSSLMTYLGRVLDLDIENYACEYDNNPRIINCVNLGNKVNKKLSYIDMNMILNGKNPKDYCLVSKKELNVGSNGKYSNISDKGKLIIDKDFSIFDKYIDELLSKKSFDNPTVIPDLYGYVNENNKKI